MSMSVLDEVIAILTLRAHILCKRLRLCHHGLNVRLCTSLGNLTRSCNFVQCGGHLCNLLTDVALGITLALDIAIGFQRTTSRPEVERIAQQQQGILGFSTHLTVSGNSTFVVVKCAIDVLQQLAAAACEES